MYEFARHVSQCNGTNADRSRRHCVTIGRRWVLSCFQKGQREVYKAFFEHYGMVVVEGVLDQVQCARAVDGSGMSWSMDSLLRIHL